MKVKELAEILELSPATVSLVLNNRPGISEATRKKVKDAVIELGCEDMINIKEKKKKTTCKKYDNRSCTLYYNCSV